MAHVLLAVFERHEPDMHVTLELVEVGSGETLVTVSRSCELCGAAEIAQTAAELGARMVPKLEGLDARFATLALRGRPKGATIELDGQPVGTLPWEGRIGAGEHRIRLTHENYYDHQHVVVATPGARELVHVALEPLPEAPRRQFLRWGVASTVVGGALLGGGSALIALDERDYAPHCNPDALGNCSHRYNTLPGGIAMVVSGALLVGAGVALLAVDPRKRARRRHAIGGISAHGLVIDF